jgi:hypothetical protein
MMRNPGHDVGEMPFEHARNADQRPEATAHHGAGCCTSRCCCRP